MRNVQTEFLRKLLLFFTLFISLAACTAKMNFKSPVASLSGSSNPVAATSSNSSPSLADGSVVTFVNENSHLCIDIPGANAAPGTKIWQHDCSSNIAQNYRVSVNSDGSYTFTNRGTGLCMDVVGASKSQGAAIDEFTCNGTVAQKFSLSAMPDGTVSIANPNSGLCIDVPDASTASGTYLQLWGCNQTEGQRYEINYNAGIPNGAIVALSNENSGFCIDIPDANPTPGTHLWQYECNATNAQRYVTSVNSDGSYTFANVGSGLCIDVVNAAETEGTAIDEYTCNGTVAQKFTLSALGDGTVSIVNPNSGLCIDVPDASTASQTYLQLWGCNQSAAQGFNVLAFPPFNYPVITPLSQSVGRYAVAEVNVSRRNESVFPNVWESDPIAVTLTAPSGTTFNISGFYYSDDLWKFRFAPEEIGTYQWRMTWTDPTGPQTYSGQITSTASADKGFIRKNPVNPYRFVYEADGSTYYPMGIGDCIWNDPNVLGTFGMDASTNGAQLFNNIDSADYNAVTMDTYFSRYGSGGGDLNMFRISDNNCAFSVIDRIDIESNGGNSYNGTALIWDDELMQDERRYGIRTYFGFFGTTVPFLGSSGNAAEMAQVSRYVKYVVARYGAMVDIWELMNESNPSGGNLDPWYSIVSGYLKSIDPYHHLVSTSWQVTNNPAIDVVSPHLYHDEAELDSDAYIAQQIDQYRVGKPVIYGENGNGFSDQYPYSSGMSVSSLNGTDANWDPGSATRMRLRNWSAFFNEASLLYWNTSSYTFWIPTTGSANLYVGPVERGYLSVLAKFAQSTDPDVEITQLTPADTNDIRGYGLQGAHNLVGYFTHYTSHSTAIKSTVAVKLPGSATVQWIDPASGNVLQSYIVGSGSQNLSMPSFTIDLALSLRY
ncbi:MAG: RICIN domain-containing protein [Oligoflexia bacterium]|nr:RICIN domain-containing protein [Oligoflexia bacterium]